ncbi:unnamed protein product [Phaeothamnion confervicola]
MPGSPPAEVKWPTNWQPALFYRDSLHDNAVCSSLLPYRHAPTGNGGDDFISDGPSDDILLGKVEDDILQFVRISFISLHRVPATLLSCCSFFLGHTRSFAIAVYILPAIRCRHPRLPSLDDAAVDICHRTSPPSVAVLGRRCRHCCRHHHCRRRISPRLVLPPLFG